MVILINHNKIQNKNPVLSDMDVNKGRLTFQVVTTSKKHIALELLAVLEQLHILLPVAVLSL